LTKIILNHELIRVYQGESLRYLYVLTNFKNDLLLFLNQSEQNLKKSFDNTLRTIFKSIKDKIDNDPFQIYIILYNYVSLYTDKLETSNTPEYLKNLQKILQKNNLFLSEEKLTSHYFYTHYIRPYVRPGFIDSYITLEPPADAIFIKSYVIQGDNRRPARVNIYQRKTKPENIYFLIPPEYELNQQELHLLETIREKLANHRPKDTSFLDAQNARDYFKNFAKKALSNLSSHFSAHSESIDMEKLADMFAQYTAGLGIIEDLLTDNNIQDVYINAPVENNPIHLIVNGEEYSSNIYLSTIDIDALASRFRTFSGRPFSEANPVLDMHLPRFHTRVAAVTNPLTPKGTAMALRRHRNQPWTLAHFIDNDMLSAEAAGLLSFLIDGQATMLIAGSRGAGKTSLLSALLLEIPQRYRILTIEDTSEIPLDELQNKGYRIQSLLTKSIVANQQSSDLDASIALRTALRLGESVLVLGEVRGIEAQVLFEAMRVGAAGNLILGTIHGSTTLDVYERIVYDIGIPPTSFKAVDAVLIAAPIRKEGGIERKRRLIQVSEIMKNAWKQNTSFDNHFNDLMSYDSGSDTLHFSDLLMMGQSTLIQSIAMKWGITVEKALENIRLRTFIKKQIVEAGQNNKKLLEAECVRDANNMFWMYLEESKQRHTTVDYGFIKHKWSRWFDRYVGEHTL